jgi:cytochrome c oxidase cbb3-type subunit 3
LAGVASVQVNAAAQRARVTWRDSQIKLPWILQALARTGYRALPLDARGLDDLRRLESRDALKRLVVAGFGAMPPLLGALGHNGVNEVAAYVVSMHGTQVPPEWAAAGKVRFQALCAACHGPEGHGNPALGAPNLFDDAWLYASNIESIVETVSNGRSGVMPAWRQRLSADDVRLTAAWVLAQSAGKGMSEGTSRAAP